MEIFHKVRPGTGLIQVAGAGSLCEAKEILDCGADLLGFPLRLTHNSPDLTEDECAAIVRELERPAACVLITYLDSASEIRQLCDFLGVGVVQLHGPVTPSELARLKSMRPGLGIIKSLIVGQGDPCAELAALAGYVDAFITDTFDPQTGASGATGLTHDWAVSRELVRLSPRPVILAGGLRPSNVLEAVLAVRPAGVDAHTGLEDAAGRKDPDLMRAFVTRAREGFARLARG